MNWGLSPLALSRPVPFVGHSKGIPITTGAEDPPEGEGGETGKTEPLATRLIDAGLVMDAGTATVLAPLKAAVFEDTTSEPAEPAEPAEPEGRTSVPVEPPEAEGKTPEPVEASWFAVTLRPTATVAVSVMVLV